MKSALTTSSIRKVSCLLALALLAGGCAHTSPRLRRARAMIGVGSVGVVAGGAVAMGCLSDDSRGRCPGQSSGTELAVGIPVMAIGAALLTYGLVRRPRPARFVEPNAATPLPDPFVKSLQSPNRSPLSRPIK